MSGWAKRECHNCEKDINRVKAEGEGYTAVTSWVPANRTPQKSGYIVIVFYYCETCWHQQQSRMFG